MTEAAAHQTQQKLALHPANQLLLPVCFSVCFEQHVKVDPDQYNLIA